MRVSLPLMVFMCFVPCAAQSFKFSKLLEARPTDYAQLQELLDKGADINGYGSHGMGHLMVATSTKDAKLVNWLLERGADPTHPRNNASFMLVVGTPTVNALIDRKVKELAKKKKSGAPPEATVKGNATPKKRKVLRPPGEQHADIWSGINWQKLDEIQAAVNHGQSLTQQEKTYKLTPLAYARKWRNEFRTFNLDTAKYDAIVTYLEKVTANPPKVKPVPKPEPFAREKANPIVPISQFSQAQYHFMTAGVLEMDEAGVSPPSIKKHVKAVLPEKGKQLGLRGYVVLGITVDPHGKAKDFEVLKGLGKGRFGFEDAAIDAVKQWQFNPGQLGNQPRPMRVALHVFF